MEIELVIWHAVTLASTVRLGPTRSVTRLLQRQRLVLTYRYWLAEAVKGSVRFLAALTIKD